MVSTRSVPARGGLVEGLNFRKKCLKVHGPRFGQRLDSLVILVVNEESGSYRAVLPYGIAVTVVACELLVAHL